MATSRKKYSAEYKSEAVQMVKQSGRPVVEVAKELGINQGTLGNWVRRFDELHPEPNTPLDAPGR